MQIIDRSFLGKKISSISTLARVGAIADIVICGAMICIWRYSIRHQNETYKNQWFWLAIMFAALAMEKVTQVDRLLHDQLRWLAQHHQFYEYRRVAQSITLMCALGLAALALLNLSMRRDLPPFMRRIRIMALVLMSFAGIRAISLHQIDSILFASLMGIHLNHLVEGGFTALILWFTWLQLKNQRFGVQEKNGSRMKRS